MDENERKAVEWLHSWLDSAQNPAGRHADTLKAMLARPKTKTVELWEIEFSARRTPSGPWEPDVMRMPGEKETDAEAALMRSLPEYSCIRVTGPHLQEVPA